MTVKQISNDAYETLIELLPTLEQMKDSIKVETKFIADRQEVAKELEPLFKFIDFGRIKGQILVNIIDPLEFIPEKTFLNIYRQKLVSNDIDSNVSRGTLYFWDKTSCGSELVIADNGKFIHAQFDCNSHQSARAKMILDSNGIFEWDFITKRTYNKYVYIGVCASENFDIKNLRC